MLDTSHSWLLPCKRPEALARKFCELADHPSREGLPRLLICWPSAHMNKFQSLLYRRAPEHGYAIERISKLAELDEIFWPGPIVLHAHWFGALSKNAEDGTEYQARIDEAFDAFRRIRAKADAKLVWTAHNILPHGSAYPEIDLALRQRIIDDFDRVHIMEQGQLSVLEQALGRTINNNIVANHPHYIGAYSDYIDRNEARELIGIDAGSTVILFFGSIQKYKGLDDLIAAFDGAQANGRNDQRLIMAGFPSDPDYVAEIYRRTAGMKNVQFLPQKILDNQIQLYFRAADAAVLPYSGSQLNSGAAMLALSFDCPIIAPSEPAFEPLRKFAISLYDKSIEGALQEALTHIGAANPDIDFSDFRRRHDPEIVSSAFFEGLDQLF